VPKKWWHKDPKEWWLKNLLKFICLLATEMNSFWLSLAVRIESKNMPQKLLIPRKFYIGHTSVWQRNRTSHQAVVNWNEPRSRTVSIYTIVQTIENLNFFLQLNLDLYLIWILLHIAFQLHNAFITKLLYTFLLLF